MSNDDKIITERIIIMSLMNRECFVVCYSMNRNDEEENDGMIK